MDIEWNETKRASNLDKHGLDFEDAALLLRSKCLYRQARTVEGEERWSAIGVLNDEYVALIFTHRDDVLRAISFRRARRGERRDHHATFGG